MDLLLNCYDCMFCLQAQTNLDPKVMEVPKGNSRFPRMLLLSIFLLKHSLSGSLLLRQRILDPNVLLGKEDLDVYTKGGSKAQARLCVYI